MNCEQIGLLIRRLRQERGMTQKQLAEALFVTDKTISKWECGMGCPDVTVLRALSSELGVPVSQILQGTLPQHEKDGGNMKKLRFYYCAECGNLMQTAAPAEISCCGRTCVAMEPQTPSGAHMLRVQRIEDDYYITFPHEMNKGHYITFVAYLTCDRMLFVRLYPEQGSEVRFPALVGGKLYFCCSKHGLFVQDGIATEPE